MSCQSYLIGSNNELDCFLLKFSINVTCAQGIYPCKFSMLCFCLVKLSEHFNTFNLQQSSKQKNRREVSNNALPPKMRRSCVIVREMQSAGCVGGEGVRSATIPSQQEG